MDGVAPVGLHEVDAEEAAADGGARSLDETRDLVVDLERGRPAAAGDVGDPVLGAAGHRGDRLAVGGEDADVAAGLRDELLDVEDLVLVAAEQVLVLEDGLGGRPGVDPGDQPAPRAGHRLDDTGVAEAVDRLERALDVEGDLGARRRDARVGERDAAADLVGTDPGGLGCVHDRDVVVVDELGDVPDPARLEGAVEGDAEAVEDGRRPLEVEPDPADVVGRDGVTARSELGEQRLLVLADAGVEQPEVHAGDAPHVGASTAPRGTVTANTMAGSGVDRGDFTAGLRRRKPSTHRRGWTGFIHVRPVSSSHGRYARGPGQEGPRRR